MKKLLSYLLLIPGFILILNGSLPAQASFEAGALRVRVDPYGAIRITRTTDTDSIQQINRASVLVSGNLNQVFDYWNDADIEDSTVLVDPSIVADYETFGVYNNNFSGEPPNILVYQNVYGWNNESFILVKMKVVNQEAAALNSSIGIDIIPRVNGTYENDSLRFDPQSEIVYMQDSTFVGVKLLGAELNTASIFIWFAEYSDSDSLLYGWMTSGDNDTTTLVTDPDGGVVILGSDQSNINPEDSAIVYFAIAVGSDESEMIANIAAAETAYNVIIPVELTSFIALALNNKVTLQWETATEINNRGFEIERKIISKKNSSEWLTIGMKEGFGTTTETQSYLFVDDVSNLNGTKLSYRLKQIDYDGTFSYSDEVLVDINSIPGKFSLEQNYPNPFNPSTKISFSLPSKELVSLRIFNMIGQEVALLVNSELEAGNYTFNFDAGSAKGLSSGIYFYTLSAGKFKSTKKMLMIK